jgi:hypothetical protein
VFQASAIGSSLLDRLTSNILLPLGGFALEVFAGWVLTERLLIAEPGLKPGTALLLHVRPRTIVPAGIAVVTIGPTGQRSQRWMMDVRGGFTLRGRCRVRHGGKEIPERQIKLVARPCYQILQRTNRVLRIAPPSPAWSDQSLGSPRFVMSVGSIASAALRYSSGDA